MKGLFLLSSTVVLIVGLVVMIGSAVAVLVSFGEESNSRQVLYLVYGVGGFITACVYMMFAAFLNLVILHLDWRVDTYYDDQELADAERKDASR